MKNKIAERAKRKRRQEKRAAEAAFAKELAEGVKQWLNRAHNIDREIKDLEAERDKAFSRAISTVNNSAGEKVQTSKINATDGKYAAYADYVAELDKRTAELYRVQAETLRVINKVDNSTYRLLLTLRYIRFMTWERIAEEMNYKDVRWVYRLHGRALRECNKYKGEE